MPYGPDRSETNDDLESDPNEWSNIAYLKGTKGVMKQHAKWLPLENADEIGPAN